MYLVRTGLVKPIEEQKKLEMKKVEIEIEDVYVDHVKDCISHVLMSNEFYNLCHSSTKENDVSWQEVRVILDDVARQLQGDVW